MTKRILCILLSVSMVLTLQPVSAMAEEANTSVDTSGEIIAFAPFTETEKTVPIGTPVEALELPESLTATVRVAGTIEDSTFQEPVQASDSDNLTVAIPDASVEEGSNDPKGADKVIGPEWEEETVDLPVTWTSKPEYDMDAGGEYVFTPVAVGYIISADLPEIKVTVEAAPMMLLAAGMPMEISSFSDLQAAINGAKGDLHLKLSDNCSTTESLTIASGNHHNITIDLSGKTLQSTGSGTAVIIHNGGGKLTIIDSSDDKDGKVTITTPSASSAVISLASASGSLVIAGSWISVDNGAAIINQTSGVVTVSDGTVESRLGYGIVSRGAGSVIISGGAVNGGECAILGLSTGNVIISGGIVSSKTKWGVTTSSGKIIIPSGSSIIKSGYQAMEKAPDLTGFLDVKITASKNEDGSSPEVYDETKIQTYKYLKFELGPMVVKNTVTGASYPSLQTAVGALTANNQTIQLMQNIDHTNALTIESGNGKSFTIDLNGKTLNGGADHPAIRHDGSGTLTITDKSIDGDGKITGSHYAIIYLNGGKLTVDSGTVENVYHSELTVITTILNEGTGKITISGTARITGKESTIYIENGIADTAILEITGGTIESTGGTAIYNSGSGRIVISSGSPIIKGGYRAMDAAPDLSSYGDVKITASTNFDGSSPEHAYYNDSYNFKTYKYLKFEPAPDIARIGDNAYTKLQEAVDAITENGQTIDLLGDIKLTFPILIDRENDKSFTLNLNGYTIDSKYRSAISHSGSGTLTITDDSAEGSGVITSIHETDYSGYTIFLNGGSLVVAGGLVENAGFNGDAIYNNNTGSVSIVSKAMVKSKIGCAISNGSTGKITISGSAKLTSEIRSVSNEGTIYLHGNAILEITGGTIENTASGSAIYSRAYGEIAIPSGSPVIVGGYMAMNVAPDLSRYPNVKVTASKLSSGTPRVIYNPNEIVYYRYLAFEPGTIVAQNTTTGAEYFTLQTAVNAAGDGETIALLGDIAFVDPLKIVLTDGKSLTLDLRGKTFEGSIDYTCTSGKLTIDDTVGGGKITAPISTFDSGTIRADGKGTSPAMLEIKGGTVENTDATGYFGYGGNAIWSRSCAVSVTGGTVTSAGGGAAILNINHYPFGAVSVTGGTVKNISEQLSAAIYNQGTGTVSVSGGTVDCSKGIAIHNDTTGKITVSGTATVTGSRGVNLKGGTANATVLEITGGTVESTAADDAIKNMEFGTVRILGGVVRTAAEGGTAIRNHSAGKIIILGGTVEHTAVGNAIYNTGWSSIEIAGGTVHAEDGKAICNEAYGTEILISSGTVSATAGTAIYNTQGFVRIVSGTAIIRGGNMAMNMEPDYLDSSLKVTASTSYDASSPVAKYNPANIETYKYLKMEQRIDTIVTNLDLASKLTAPATGGTPEAAITEDDQYTGTVKWSGSPTKFLGSTVYTATVTLTAKEDYTFSGIAENAFTRTGATGVTSDLGTGKTLTVTIVFPGTAVKELQSIAITKAPDKVDYKYGETFAILGMVVKATYNDGTESANFTNYTVDKTGTLIMEDTVITLTANGTSITANQTIAVNKADGPTAPSVAFSFDGIIANKLMGATALMEYSLDGGGSWTDCTADTNLTASRVSITVKSGIKVRVKETSTHNEGAIKTIDITQPSAPIIGKTNETSARNDGTITGVSNLMEYKKSEAASYTSISGSTVTGLAPGEYLVRIKATGTALASPDATVEINKTDYKGTTTVAARVLASGQTRATVTLPALPAGASYGVPTASGLITMSDMTIAGTTLTYTASESTAGQTATITIPVTGATNYNNYSVVVTVTSTVKAGGGSGGGSSSDNNSSPIIVTPPAPDKPYAPTQGEIKVPGKVDGKGSVIVDLSDQTVTDAFEKAFEDAKKNGDEKNGITLVLRVDTGSKTGSDVTVNLPKTVQDTIIAKKIVTTVVVVNNPDIRIGMDLAVVEEIHKQANSDVNITAESRDSSMLTGDAKDAIGSRPVFDLKVNYGNGKQVQNFGTGSVTVTIPYTLGANENAENICAVYVNANDQVHWLTDSVYDSTEKLLRFSTDHFSTYGVGYKQSSTAFTDIESHWAKEAIGFVVSRGLFSGTSANTFSPNTSMTRGMFVTVLGRLAGADVSSNQSSFADVSSYNQSSFTDVKSDAYYMGYIEWASKTGVVKGTGKGKFAPDQSISREQMAVIMSNYAKVMDIKLQQTHEENIFGDSANISTYAKDAVKQMQISGILSGKNGNLFDPKGTATRAEVSAVLRRFVELENTGNALQR